jgi:hypothetical protein
VLVSQQFYEIKALATFSEASHRQLLPNPVATSASLAAPARAVAPGIQSLDFIEVAAVQHFRFRICSAVCVGTPVA